MNTNPHIGLGATHSLTTVPYFIFGWMAGLAKDKPVSEIMAYAMTLAESLAKTLFLQQTYHSRSRSRLIRTRPYYSLLLNIKSCVISKNLSQWMMIMMMVIVMIMFIMNLWERPNG